MPRLPSNPALVLTLLFAASFATGVWLVQRERDQADRAVAARNRKAAERDWLAKQMPALSAENEQAIAAELVQAGHALADLRADLEGDEPGWLNTPPPATPLDAYFDLSAFVERSRVAAGEAKIAFVADEHFGFSAYANAGPAAEWVPAVFRQRLLVQRLVEAVIESHPLALLSVRRELPVQPAGKHAAADFFTFDRALSLRQPGRLDTVAFRLEFSGQAATLRNFLNSLAGFSQPFVVRSVEVEPLPASGSPGTPGRNGAVSLIRPNSSKFAVIVEFVRLETNSVPPAS